MVGTLRFAQRMIRQGYFPGDTLHVYVTRSWEPGLISLGTNWIIGHRGIYYREGGQLYSWPAFVKAFKRYNHYHPGTIARIEDRYGTVLY